MGKCVEDLFVEAADGKQARYAEACADRCDGTHERMCRALHPMVVQLRAGLCGWEQSFGALLVPSCGCGLHDRKNGYAAQALAFYVAVLFARGFSCNEACPL